MALDRLNTISNSLIAESQNPEPNHYRIREIVNDIFWLAPGQISGELVADTNPDLTQVLHLFCHQQINQSLQLDTEGVLIRWEIYVYDLGQRMTPRGARPGSHGLIVGDCWPKWQSMRLEGVHGHTQCGIHGRKTYGAYSVVVNGSYNDVDNGDDLWYWGTHSPNGIISPPTKLLRKNLRTGNPVRVVRGAHGDPGWQTSRGFRYDGLYRVALEEERGGPGNYIFRLERLEGQPDIQRNKPDNFTLTSWERYNRY